MNETAHPLLPLPTAGPCRRASLAPYCDRVRLRLSPERYAHVLRVAELAEQIALANRFDAGELRATCLAAVLHDVAREETAARLFELAPPESDLEREHPLALHGRAGRAVAEAWGVDSAEVDAAESRGVAARAAQARRQRRRARPGDDEPRAGVPARARGEDPVSDRSRQGRPPAYAAGA